VRTSLVTCRPAAQLGFSLDPERLVAPASHDDSAAVMLMDDD
jgi:hypothetical protein